MHYHVFISYRRETGDTMARFLYDRLKEDGYHPFLDVEQMRSGRFNTQLYDRIAECEDFLLILSPGALDRCRNEDDWLRMEILEALRLHRNIVPFILRDFEFPSEPTRLQKLLGGQQLPREILDLRYFQGVAASQEYFDSAFARLKSLLFFQPDLLTQAASALESSPSVTPTAPVNISALLDRAFMFIEEGQFGQADVCLEQVLNQDARNARAYLGKLLIAFRQHRPEHLAELKVPINQSPDYQKILRFGDPALQEQLRTYSQTIQERIHSDAPAPVDPSLQRPEPAVPDPALISPRQKHPRNRTLPSILLVLLALAVGLGVYSLCRQLQLHHAVLLFKAGQQEQALAAADPQQIYYTLAQEYLQQGQQGYACLYFMKAGNYRDSRQQMRALQRVLGGKIAAGNFFTAAVTQDGSVLYTGNTERPSSAASWKNVKALVASDRDIVGIKKDGSLLYTDTPFDPGNGGPYVTVCAIQTGFFAVAEDGSVFLHGREGYLSDSLKIAESWTDIVAADGYYLHSIALKRDGTVYASSDGHEYSLGSWKDIVGVAIGSDHFVGLRSDSTLVTAGSNAQQQCDVEDWQNIVAISASYNTTYGLKSDGTVVTTDDYLSAELAQWRDIVAISSGFLHVVGLKADGTLVAAGHKTDHEAGECNVSGWDLLD